MPKDHEAALAKAQKWEDLEIMSKKSDAARENAGVIDKKPTNTKARNGVVVYTTQMDKMMGTLTSHCKAGERGAVMEKPKPILKKKQVTNREAGESDDDELPTSEGGVAVLVGQFTQLQQALVTQGNTLSKALITQGKNTMEMLKKLHERHMEQPQQVNNSTNNHPVVDSNEHCFNPNSWTNDPEQGHGSQTYDESDEDESEEDESDGDEVYPPCDECFNTDHATADCQLTKKKEKEDKELTRMFDATVLEFIRNQITKKN
jgi:hypothetical protein